MVAVAILGIVLSGLYNLFNNQSRSFEAQRDVSITQRDIRASLSLMERDIRMAGLGVPRGTNPVAAVVNGAAGAPDNISINFSPGPFTHLVSATVESPGVNNTIQVNSVTNFRVGDTINLISFFDNNLRGNYVVNAVDTGNNKLSLNADPSAAGIEVGDFVARNFKTISYSVVPNAVTGRNELIRGDGVVQSTIIDGVVDFQLSYILTDDTEVTSPGTLADIRRVRIDITSGTIRDAARLQGQQIPREILTIVPVKNIRL
jgi:hypothetical protein